MENKTTKKTGTNKEMVRNYSGTKKTSGKKSRRKKSRKKKFTWKHTLTLGVVFALFACLALVFYISVGNMYFLRGTKINGHDISGKTLNDAVDSLVKAYNEKEISILEDGQVVYSTTQAELGYKVDEAKLKEIIGQQMEEQKDKVFLQFFSSKTSEIEMPFIYEEEKISSEIVEANLTGERVESQNAEVVFDGENYIIQEEVYGNKIIEENLQALVKQQMEANLANSEDIQIALTSDMYYSPEIKAEDTQVITQMNAYNQYCHAEITYIFGDKKEVLDWETIQNWIVIDGESISLSEEAVGDYVDTLRRKYNTIYVNRTIKTTYGGSITLPSNDYGYRIDRAKEIEQLMKDVSSNTAVEREPIYSHKGYHRSGQDDVLGCYIEIDLTNQHIWLYKNYNLIVESDIVTGDPGYQETQTGAFPIAFKKSPSVLSGETWNTEVTYWMPFHDGQGLHDATWRSTFGGDIYLTDGSHGCVNLPYSVAEKIYNNIEAGYPIFLYKLDSGEEE